MPRRGKDGLPSSEKESNGTSERFKKMQIKLGIPITSVSIGNSRKREKMDRLHHQIVHPSESRNWGGQPVSHSNSSENRDAQYAALDFAQREPAETTTISFADPLASNCPPNQDLQPDSNMVTDSEDADPQCFSPHSFKVMSSSDEQPDVLESGDLDDPRSIFSCPTDSQLCHSFPSNIDRKHNVSNIVAEIRMKAKYHHLRRKVMIHQDRSSPVLRFQSAYQADTSHQQFERHENPATSEREELASEKPNHIPFSTWREVLRQLLLRNGGDAANPAEVYPSSSVVPDQGSSVNTDKKSEGTSSRKQLLPSPLTIPSPTPASGFPQSPIYSEFTPTPRTARSSINVFARSVPLFGGRLFNNDSPIDDNRYGLSANEGEVDKAERLLGSGKNIWSRRLDWKRRVPLAQRARSWSNAEQRDSEDSSPSATDSGETLESTHLTRLREQVQSLRAALLRSEHELSQLKAQTSHYRQEMRSKLRRLSTAHSCLHDAQELRFRSALDALNDNQKVLGYVESSFDHVLSVIGSGRNKCPGLRGHFFKALRYFGDGSIELVFQVIRLSTKIYAFLRRVDVFGNNNSVKI